jgi:hypothetical protein
VQARKPTWKNREERKARRMKILVKNSGKRRKK